VVSVVLNRLLEGAEVVASPFDRRSVWTYRIIGFEMVAAAILIVSTGFRISSAVVIATVASWPFLLCAAAMLLRRYGHSRMSGGMEMLALAYGQGFTTLFMLIPLTVLSRPLADGLLGSIDQALGFNWLAYASLFAWRPLVQHILAIAYNSFGWQPMVIVLTLAAKGFDDRCWRLVTASAIAGVVTAALYPFAPAMGTFYHYSVNPAAFPNLHSPWQFGPILQEIKTGPRIIAASSFTGLVSFPSYHAAAAVMFAWAMWPFRFARWPFVILNVAVCGAAMIAGGHYLIDILAGIAIAAVSIWLAGQLLGKAAVGTG
jgi:membrane-associated phospholipid phosphatase